MIPRTKLEDITEVDIQRLIDNGAREGRTLDFKMAAELAKDNRQGLAEDVCAFANAFGGDLVIGVEPFDKSEGDSAAAKAIDPVRVPNLDAALLELVSSLRDSLEPRLATLHAHPVPLACGGHVLVLRVGASPSAPHRVVRKGGGHFFLRNSVGKEAMDIHAIRTAFGHATSLNERARAFRDDRVAALRERRAQLPVPPGPLLAVHVIPVQSLTRPSQYPIESLKVAAAHLQHAQPAGHEVRWPRPNLEGVICPSENNEEREYAAFAQLFRDGCIEFVGSLEIFSPISYQKLIYPGAYERSLALKGLPAAIAALNTLDIAAPIYLSVGLLNVRDLHIDTGERIHPADFPQLPSHVTDVVSPLVYVEDLAGPAVAVLSPAFDPLWNAVGFGHSTTNFASEP